MYTACMELAARHGKCPLILLPKNLHIQDEMEGGALNIVCTVLLAGTLVFYLSLCVVGKRYHDEKHAHHD